MEKQLFVAAAIALLVGVGAQSNPPETVTELEVEYYLGRWYQMYCNLFVNVTFERNAFCVTADYGAINATHISVLNANNRLAPDGDLDTVSGYGFVPDLSEPGKLLVQLDRGSPSPTEYWILQLGPVTNDQYQYSIVSNSWRAALFVLARDVESFKTDYEEEVLTYLADNGFNTRFTEPLETYQGSDCNYS